MMSVHRRPQQLAAGGELLRRALRSGSLSGHVLGWDVSPPSRTVFRLHMAGTAGLAYHPLPFISAAWCRQLGASRQKPDKHPGVSGGGG